MVPLAQAMVLCDSVYRDSSTGKFFLLGTFSVIYTGGFPTRHGHMSVYAVLTECRKKTPITLKLVYIDNDESKDEELHRIDRQIAGTDPLDVHELVFDLHELVFSKEGEYRFQLESGGEPLLEKRLVVKLRRAERESGTDK
jgi:hypothetical protein